MNKPLYFFSLLRFDVKYNVSCDCYLILDHWASSSKTLMKGYRIYCTGKLFTRNPLFKYSLVISMSKKRLICENNWPYFFKTLFPKLIPREVSYIFLAKVFFLRKFSLLKSWKKCFWKNSPIFQLWNLIQFMYFCTFVSPILYGYLEFFLSWGGEIKNYPILKSGNIKPKLKI